MEWAAIATLSVFLKREAKGSDDADCVKRS
jgi:hypothetical protein